MTVTQSETTKTDSPNNSGFYSGITIQRFRQFKNLELNNLGKINLILGPNNVGKTSILEAIYIHSCYGNIRLILDNLILPKVSQSKNISGFLEVGDQILSLFNKKSKPPLRFEIALKDFNGSFHIMQFSFYLSRKLMDLDPRKLTFLGSPFEKDNFLGKWTSSLISAPAKENGFPPHNISNLFFDSENNKINVILQQKELEDLIPQCIFSDILAHREPQATVAIFSHLKRYRLLEKFTQEMSMIFPIIKQIDTIPYPDGSFSPIYIINSKDELLPIYNFGDGMRRWFHLLGNLMIYPNSVHLIEEIDATFHPNAQEKFGHLLVEYAEKFNNQLFMTSHNLEFADKFLESLYGEEGSITEDLDDPVRVITIGQSRDDPEETTVWNLTGRQAYRGRKLYNVELR